MEHTVDVASWRRWTQFSLKSLMLLVLMVALFFSGRATLQQEVHASRATFARQRELHAQMMDFRNRLKPLKLPPGVTNRDRNAKPDEIDPWTNAGNWGDDGYCCRSYYRLNIAQRVGTNKVLFLPEDRVGEVVNNLARQIGEQSRCDTVSADVGFDSGAGSNAAVAVLRLRYGVTILVGVLAGNPKRGENFRDVMQLEIIHAHQVALNP